MIKLEFTLEELGYLSHCLSLKSYAGKLSDLGKELAIRLHNEVETLDRDYFKFGYLSLVERG